MKIAKFDCPQPPVLYKQFDGVDYVYICVNERVEEGEDGREYVYDHAELIGKNLPVDEIEKDPDRFLDYVPESNDLENVDVLAKTVKALQNSYDAMFDGIKIVSSYDNPLPMTLPVMVRRNVFYKYNGHVYVANQDAIVDEDNFGLIMDDMDAPAV